MGVAMVVVFLLLLRLGLPHSDGTPRRIGANEHLTSAYAVLLVALLIGGIAIAFAALE